MIEYRLTEYDTEWLKPKTEIGYDLEGPEPLDAQNCSQDYFDWHDGWKVTKYAPWIVEVKVNGVVKKFEVDIQPVPEFFAKETK